MEPATFRRDPYLRTSAYHLATWSIAGFVFELRLRAPGMADDPTGVAAAVVLVGASFLTSMTHARRVAKMAGPAGEPVYAGVGRMWHLLITVMVVVSVVLMAGFHPEALFPVWMVGVGVGLAIWGRKGGFPWYAGSGLALVAVGVLDAALCATTGPSLALRALVLAVGLPGLALATNRKFLWVRRPAGA